MYVNNLMKCGNAISYLLSVKEEATINVYVQSLLQPKGSTIFANRFPFCSGMRPALYSDITYIERNGVKSTLIILSYKYRYPLPISYRPVNLRGLEI